MSNNAYVDRVWYSVIDKTTGKKYCDCGWEQDAINLVNMDPQNRTYIRNDHHLYGQTIDITPPPALPTNEIVTSSPPKEYLDALYPDIDENEKEPVVLPSGQIKLPAGQQQPFVV